ncbi:GDSL esterase/lipase At4g10955-like [Solanum lycopersicum]|uniref:Fungal lipase-like domain-containing protein n=1 Tax=Solanum lycopersicum TaxID=4081 RepID=A0A3Q7F214_SOLLC|nr:GDSL esterase/lipase At4g10955-like [Solanum lycopersicum]
MKTYWSFRKNSMERNHSFQYHPKAFHVFGPRHISSPGWRELISSSWKNESYKRAVMACFVQSAYLLELDRQENRYGVETALAPQWWTPFKYKLVEPLVDERDGSIFAAILEWDQAAALADFIPVRPTGAPKVVLAIRGTLLKNPTIRRDVEDDLRYLAWESLRGSFRFERLLSALKSIIFNQQGSKNVSITGHSLGAGFALEVYKTLAAEGTYVEAHLFNPPSVSLAMSYRILSGKAGFVWKRFKSMLPSNSEYQSKSIAEGAAESTESRITSELKQMLPMPHLYVNTSDYICCYYNYSDGVQNSSFNIGNKEREVKPGGNALTGVKLFVVSKAKQRFLEAHRLKQWWSDDLELQMALNNSMLISRKLNSLYTIQPPKQTQG